VLMEVRDETIKVTDQIVGVAWMKIQQGLEEQISQLLVRRDGAVFFCQRFIYFVVGLVIGSGLMFGAVHF